MFVKVFLIETEPNKCKNNHISDLWTTLSYYLILQLKSSATMNIIRQKIGEGGARGHLRFIIYKNMSSLEEI